MYLHIYTLTHYYHYFVLSYFNTEFKLLFDFF